MAMGSISISTCRALTQSVENAGGATPAVLRNLLEGYDDLADQTAPSDPARQSSTHTRKVNRTGQPN